MFSILDYYLLRELSKVFFAIFIVLTLIIISLLFLRTIEEINLNSLGFIIVLKLLRLQLIRDASSLLPPTFFLAALITLNQLAHDSELIALHACGVGSSRIYKVLFLLAVPLAIITAWLALVLQPEVTAQIQAIRLQQDAQAAKLSGLQPGRFYVEKDGGIVVYIGSIEHQQILNNILLLDRRGTTTKVVVSVSGHHQLDEKTGDHLVTLEQGYRFDGNPGFGNFLIAKFTKYQFRIQGENPIQQANTKRATTETAKLWRSPHPADQAEFEHRIGAPLAIFTLALIAVPLVTISPRQSSTGRLALAGIAYFSFFNLQRLAENWLEIGVTPTWLGSLWYQLIILGLVYLILLPESYLLFRYSLRRK